MGCIPAISRNIPDQTSDRVQRASRAFRLGITLAASQRDAVKRAVASKVMVITGGPGVGKTTLVNAILRILGVKGITVALAAPPNVSRKALGWKRRPFTVCWR